MTNTEHGQPKIRMTLKREQCQRLPVERLIASMVYAENKSERETLESQGYIPQVEYIILHTGETASSGDGSAMMIKLSDEINEIFKAKNKTPTAVTLFSDISFTYIQVQIVNKFDTYFIGHYGSMEDYKLRSNT